MPMRIRTSIGSVSGPTRLTLSGRSVIAPWYFVAGCRSCMRLKQRRNVLLPQPEGPISAVTWFSAIGRSMFFSAWLVPYQKLSFSAAALGGFARVALRSSNAMATDGVSAFWALVSPCIGAACFCLVTTWSRSRSVAMALTS